jgi:hypothetical protein
MSVLAEVAAEVLKRKAKEAATEIVMAGLLPALKAAVIATATPWDDMLLANLEGPMKAELTKLIANI